jgi:hypothetical protein
MAAVPWAILTSALEWFILVQLFPFWQPIFTLQQPYWIGFLVHLSSASMYPLFAWLLAFRTQGIRGQNVSPGLEPWNYSRRPVGACGATCCPPLDGPGGCAPTRLAPEKS